MGDFKEIEEEAVGEDGLRITSTQAAKKSGGGFTGFFKKVGSRLEGARQNVEAYKERRRQEQVRSLKSQLEVQKYRSRLAVAKRPEQEAKMAKLQAILGSFGGQKQQAQPTTRTIVRYVNAPKKSKSRKAARRQIIRIREQKPKAYNPNDIFKKLNKL